MNQNASLDASFWINACAGNVVQFVPRYFHLFTPDVVAREIRYPLDILGIEATSVTLFDKWCRQGKVVLQNPKLPVDWFQRGENAAIALAIEYHYFLLIDDANPYHRARAAGLKVIGTAEFVILLYDHARLAHQEATEAIKHTHASKKQKRQALITLETLARQKGA